MVEGLPFQEMFDKADLVVVATAIKRLREWCWSSYRTVIPVVTREHSKPNVSPRWENDLTNSRLKTRFVTTTRTSHRKV